MKLMKNFIISCSSCIFVINAVEGDEFFNFSPWGVVTFHPDATTTFVANPTGRNRYQEPGILKWSEDMLQKIRDYTMIR